MRLSLLRRAGRGCSRTIVGDVAGSFPVKDCRAPGASHGDDPDGGKTIVIEGDEFEERDGRRVKTGDKHLRVRFFPNGTSESTGHRTDANGNKISKSQVKGKNRLNPDTKRWEDVAAAVFGLDSPIPVAITSVGVGTSRRSGELHHPLPCGSGTRSRVACAPRIRKRTRSSPASEV